MVASYLAKTRREVDRSSRKMVREATMYNIIESGIALTASFVINVFIVAVFARLFYKPDNLLRDSGIWPPPNKIKDCFGDKIGLRNTGDVCLNSVQRLLDIKSWPMKTIWGLGLLSAGLSSTMTGTYAG